MKVLLDEGFLDFFGDDRDEAKRLLGVLISDSERHKATLQNILSRI